MDLMSDSASCIFCLMHLGAEPSVAPCSSLLTLQSSISLSGGKLTSVDDSADVFMLRAVSLPLRREKWYAWTFFSLILPQPVIYYGDKTVKEITTVYAGKIFTSYQSIYSCWTRLVATGFNRLNTALSLVEVVVALIEVTQFSSNLT